MKKIEKRFSSKTEKYFLQNQKTIFSNQKTIFFKIRKLSETFFSKISNAKVGHILHKSMTHSLDIQYMCWHTQHCKF